MRLPLFCVKIEGDSMWPALVPGRMYWASGWLPARAGDTIVFKHSSKTLVKRIARITASGYQTQGTHSRAAAYFVPRKAVIGKIFNL